MFEPGFRRLHAAIVSFTVGFWAFFFMLVVFIFILSVGNVVDAKELIEKPVFIVPLLTWVIGILFAFCLYLTIKCKSCGRRLLVVTDMSHENKNKGWMFWFLKPIPPNIVCEHCGEVFNNAPNQSLKSGTR